MITFDYGRGWGKKYQNIDYIVSERLFIQKELDDKHLHKFTANVTFSGANEGFKLFNKN